MLNLTFRATGGQSANSALLADCVGNVMFYTCECLSRCVTENTLPSIQYSSEYSPN